MKAIEVIRWALTMTDEATRQLAWDMSDAPLTQPTSSGGNHPLWCLGHMAYLEAGIPSVLYGEPNPLEHWAPLFAPGTQPTTDAAMYPSFDKVLGAYRDVRARTLKLLDSIGDAGLDRKPAAVPPGAAELLQTFGHTFMLFALHTMLHYGQIADTRRVVGRKPLR